MSEPNNQVNPDKGSRWSQLKRGVKKGFKIVLPIAASWAAGVIFPPAGAALYKFLKDKLDQSRIKISDETLHKLCEDAIGKKTPDLILEKLQESLREEIGKSTEINKEHLEMVLGTFLRPLNDSINDAMKYIKEFPDQIEYLMGEWKAENAQLIKELQTDMLKNFDEVKSSIANQSEKIDVILTKLKSFENILNEDFWRGVEQIFSSKKIKALDLKLVSQAQISMANFSSRYDINFNPEYFTSRKESDDAFRDFLNSITSHSYSQKNGFLVLAGAGMGKTWLLASWIHKISEEQFDMPKTQKFVPFFISLGLGFDGQFCELFGASSRFGALDNLAKAKATSTITPILFFDGLDEAREEASTILQTIINLSKERIPVVLSCRDIDWVEEKDILKMQSTLRKVFYEHQAGSSYEYKDDASCMPSLSFDTFTPSEFLDAVKLYQIPKEAFYNKKLKEIGCYPILLRLLSNYYKINNRLPDPTNPDDFEDIFLGKEKAKAETYILGRLGVTRLRKDYLVLLTRKFLDIGKDELSYEDLRDFINQKEEYKVIRSAGLIKERISRKISTRVYLNEIYRPHLIHMVELDTGIVFEKPDVSTPIESIPLEKENSADRKKYDYFAKMGNDYLESKEYQEALDNFQQAREVCMELYDPKLTKEADSLIKKTENLIKKEKEAKAKAKREAEEKARLQTTLKPILQQKIHASAKEISKEVNAPLEIIKLSLEQFAIWDGESNQFWINTEELENSKLQRIISFRGAQIPQFEANIIQELESLTLKFKLVDKMKSKVSKNTFAVKNNHIIGIGCPLSSLNTIPESIMKLESLEWIDLANNKLKTLPESMGNLTSLTYLNLTGNKLSILPESIGGLKLLQELYLTRNELKTLPESISNLKLLQKLDLRSNKFTTFHDSISNLKLLQKLDLRWNMLTALPESIGVLTSLQHLSLSGNKLKTLPESMGNLTSLEILGLVSIKLISLPESISNLKLLKELYINDNELRSLPESILNLKSLKKLKIDKNPLVYDMNSETETLLKQLRKNGVKIIK